MKKLSLIFIAVLLVMTGCSLNEYAVKKTIQAGANIGIIAMDYTGPQPKNITYIVARNFLAEGYIVKAINTIQSELTYPFLRELFEGELELQFKTRIESLLEHSVDTSTPFKNEGRIKKELEEIKRIVGLDYLVVLYKVDSGSRFLYTITAGIHMLKSTYNLVGIDLGNYEIVYVHHYEFTTIPLFTPVVNMFTPFSEERKLNKVIKQFITTLQEVGSKESYSPW